MGFAPAPLFPTYGSSPWDDSILMGMSVVGTRRMLALAAAVAVTAGTMTISPPGAAQEADPLVQSSLDALSKLVTPETCQKRDAADGNVDNGIELLYVFCDDGVPPSGGGEAVIPVPA